MDIIDIIFGFLNSNNKTNSLFLLGCALFVYGLFERSKFHENLHQKILFWISIIGLVLIVAGLSPFGKKLFEMINAEDLPKNSKNHNYIEISPEFVAISEGWLHISIKNKPETYPEDCASTLVLPMYDHNISSYLQLATIAFTEDKNKLRILISQNSTDCVKKQRWVLIKNMILIRSD